MAENLQNGSEQPLDFGNQQIPPQMGTYLKWGGVIVGLVVLFAALSFFRSIYTDLLWFDSLGFRGVFTKILVTRAVLFAVGAVLFSSLLGLSLIIAGRSSAGPITLQLQPEAIEQAGLAGVGLSNAAESELRTVDDGHDDIDHLDPPDLLEQRPRTVAEPRTALPAFQGLPHREGSRHDA